MRIVLAPLALALLVAPPALAQKKGKAAAKAPAASAPAKPANVKLALVHDRRNDTGFFNRLEINLELPDVPAADVTAVRTTVKAATDDTGRNLVPDDSGKSGMQPTQTGREKDPAAKPEPVKVMLELKNPSRRAAVVKSVTGEIELYMPGKDPNGVASVPKFLAQPGKPLASPALKTNGVEITVLGKDQLEAEKQVMLNKVKQDAKKKGIKGEQLQEMLTERSNDFLKPEENDVVLKVKAPQGRIQQFAYLNAAGEEKLVGASERQGFTILSTWGDKPGPDWGLRVSLNTPKTLARYSYALKDVPLP